MPRHRYGPIMPLGGVQGPRTVWVLRCVPRSTASLKPTHSPNTNSPITLLARGMLGPYKLITKSGVIMAVHGSRMLARAFANDA